MLSHRPDPRHRAVALIASGALLAALAPARAAGADDPARALRSAAARADAQALADQAVLPFLFEGRQLDRAQFVAEAVPALFTPAVRRCLQRAPAQAEGEDRVLWCKPYGFYLRRVDGTWRLAEFAVDVP